MILLSFAVENFRQYFQKQEIRFSIDNKNKRNITIINGVNGAGKTSLFIAINWCLYGFEAIGNASSVKVESEKDLFCKEAISRAAPGARVMMSATLTFHHGGERYTVTRSKGAIKDLNGDILVDKSYHFKISKKCLDNQTIVISNEKGADRDPEAEIRKVLPVEASRYFFFDGERIDAITRPESKQVADAINNIFRVNTLNFIKKKINRLIEKYEHKIEASNQDDKDLTNAIQEKRRLEEDLDKLHRERESLSIRIDELKEYRERISRELKEKVKQNDELNQLQEGISRLNELLEKSFKDLDGLMKEVQGDLTGAYPLLAEPLVEKACRLLEEREELQDGALSHLTQELVRDLLHQRRCICGRPFEEGGPEYQRLRALLESAVPGGHSSESASLCSRLFSLQQSSREKLRLLQRDHQQYSRLRDAITSQDLERERLQDLLATKVKVDVADLQRKWEKATDDYYSLDQKFRDIEDKISRKNDEVQKLENKIDYLQKKKRSNEIISDIYSISKDVKRAIDENMQKYKEEVRRNIGKKASEIFSLLLWKNEQFREVVIDENFNLEVLDRYDKPALQDLSSGERQVLSLSFIVAMSRLSREEAPLMMDTPFGRLSAENRVNITEHVPALADQLILLVTDEELHGQARANLEPHIGREYNLRFDLQSGCTTIEEVLQ